MYGLAPEWLVSEWVNGIQKLRFWKGKIKKKDLTGNWERVHCGQLQKDVASLTINDFKVSINTSKIDEFSYTVCPGSSDPPEKILNIFASENEVYTIF